NRWQLRPRILSDVTEVSTETTVLGTPVSLPVLVAPVAFQRMAHPDGEAATARAAAAAGTLMCLSTIATATPAEVAAAAPDAPRWFQLYVFKDWGVTTPVVGKGVLTAEDARLACEHGAAAIAVSNHGGRQLDGVPASLDALPEVAEAVDGRVEVYLDGGVRRGTDVVKALALGARATLAGRAVLYGLASGGEAGARHVLELLREEIRLALSLLGCTSPDEVDRGHVAPTP